MAEINAGVGHDCSARFDLRPAPMTPQRWSIEAWACMVADLSKRGDVAMHTAAIKSAHMQSKLQPLRSTVMFG